MTRTFQTCLAIAFLTLLAKSAGGYAAYAFARDIHLAGTGNEIIKEGLSGIAARDWLRARALGAEYLALVQHLHVVLMALAGVAYALAAGGGRRSAAALCALVLLAVPLDLPVALAHLAQAHGDVQTGLPPEMSWSWMPRNPLAMLRVLAGPRYEPAYSPGDAVMLAGLYALSVPGMLAAAMALVRLRGATSARRGPEAALALASA